MGLKIVIVEDNKTIRNGLRFMINSTEGMEALASFSNVEDYLQKLPELKADVTLMDIGLPGKSGIEGVIETKKIYPEAVILMQTVYEDSENIFNALCAGASGYILKKTAPLKIIEAIKDASAGGSPMSSTIARKVVEYFNKKPIAKNDSEIELSEREKEILTGLTQGKSYKMIADQINLSIDAVRYHISKIYKKLHVHNQSEAVSKAISKNLL